MLEEGNTSSVDRLDLEERDEAGMTSLRTEMSYRNMTPETIDGVFETMIDLNMLTVPDHPSHDKAGTKRSSLSNMGTPYTVSSLSPNQVDEKPLEGKRASGRQRGSHLTEEALQNVHQGRKIGSWIRCRVLKKKCSVETPCINCAHDINDRRKWDGCLRSLEEIANLLVPDNLAASDRDDVEAWMLQNTYVPPEQARFELPLDFGFGPVFQGFLGVEYITKDESKGGFTVTKSDQRPEPPIIHAEIPVCPVSDNSTVIQKLIWDWLKQTLRSNGDMEKWRQVCFHGPDVEWIRGVVLSTWKYYMQSWEETKHNEAHGTQLDEILLEAWMAALLVAMLSLPIMIPEQAVENIRHHLRFGTYDPSSQYSRTSGVADLCVKSLFFDMYKRSLERLASALHELEKNKAAEIFDRDLGHIHCTAILIVVITSLIQTLLMDTGRWVSVQSPRTPYFWRDTFEQIQGVESAYKNSILFIHHTNKRWLKENSISDTSLRDYRREVQEIEQTFHNDIKTHRNTELEGLMIPDIDNFHTLNMQRLFAFLFGLMYTRDRR